MRHHLAELLMAAESKMTPHVHLHLYTCESKTFGIAWIPVKAMGHRLSKSRGISGIIYVGSFNSSAALNYLIIYSIFNYFYVQSFTNISEQSRTIGSNLDYQMPFRSGDKFKF